MRRDAKTAMDFEQRENFGFAVGEARDFLVRHEQNMLDMLDKLEQGKITFIAARLAVGLDIRNAMKDLENWQKWWGWSSAEAGLPYVRKELTLQPVIPFSRIEVKLPEGA